MAPVSGRRQELTRTAGIPQVAVLGGDSLRALVKSALCRQVIGHAKRPASPDPLVPKLIAIGPQAAVAS